MGKNQGRKLAWPRLSVERTTGDHLLLCFCSDLSWHIGGTYRVRFVASEQHQKSNASEVNELENNIAVSKVQARTVKIMVNERYRLDIGQLLSKSAVVMNLER